jgi:RES domain-containing protein
VIFGEVCYRFHDPRWAVYPLSGAGAGRYGRRFNRRGTDTLYLSTGLETAFHEVRQGRTIVEPHTLVCYRTSCRNIADLRTANDQERLSVSLSELGCAWSLIISVGGTPPSWEISERLMSDHDGLLVPSFAEGTDPDRNFNRVLWKWNGEASTSVEAYDPTGRLPKDQWSWGGL